MADEKKEQQAQKDVKPGAQTQRNLSAAALKKHKKKWYPVLAPKFFNNMPLGESLLDEAAQLVGKTVSTSMMNISNDPKQQQISLTFKVTKLQEGKGVTEITKYDIPSNWFRRMVRRERKKMDDSFICKTVDGQFAIVKPILITNGAASHKTITDLKKNTRQLLKEVIHNNSFEAVIQDLLDYKVQKYLKEMLHKIYPVRVVEIRSFELTKATRETVDNILVKGLPKVEEVEEEEPEDTEDAVEVIDQAAEAEEEKKQKAAAEAEENPISEGV